MFLFKLFMLLQVAIFRLTNGKLGASMRGMPVLLLTTVGRKTKKVRTTPLIYFRDGDNYVITASNNGSDRHPSWLYNLKASPQTIIEVPGKQIQAVAQVASPTERERLWSLLVAQAPYFENYRKGTSRTIPVVVLKPV